MFPTLEGMIARRVLVNFRVDPALARRLVPEPLDVATHRGHAVVGVCLIRLEHLRPQGLPQVLGLSSENMAHRIAIRYPTPNGMKDGVFIWRRDTDQRAVALLGGRVFPGVHRHAQFDVRENQERIVMDVRTQHREADVSLKAASTAAWNGSKVFQVFEEACAFFRRGDCGFSCSRNGATLEGIQLHPLKWQMSPLRIEYAAASFYEDAKHFPKGSIEFDCALLMRGIPHQWSRLPANSQLVTATHGRAT